VIEPSPGNEIQRIIHNVHVQVHTLTEERSSRKMARNVTECTKPKSLQMLETERQQ